MKNHRMQLLLASTLALGLGATLPFLLGNSAWNPERESVKSEVASYTTSPTVPAKVSLAGQEIDFQRYDLRERMDRELLAFTYMHSSTLLSIKRANRYFPIIEPILKANGVPDDFKFLAVIESGLNPIVRSPAGAIGLWQFMPDTARQFGLEVNANVDERYHVEKSTVAACRYLKQAYAKYRNWICVAASFNGGQGRISTELAKQMANEAMDLWLTEETSRYMFRLMAAKLVLNNPQQYGFLLKRQHLYPQLPYTEVSMDSTIGNLAQFAKERGLTFAQLKDANPWLREMSLNNKSGRTYLLKIPTREGLFYDPLKTVPHNKNWVVD